MRNAPQSKPTPPLETPPSATATGCLTVFGLMWTGFFSLTTLGFVAGLFDSVGSVPAELAMTAVFGVFALTGLVMLWSAIKRMQRAARLRKRQGKQQGSERTQRHPAHGGPPRRRRASMSASERERRILALARGHGGRMTVSDLAVESPLSVEESKRALERFVDQGVADTWVSEFGQIVYVFPAFFDEGDKHTASSPLEDPLEESFEQLENRTTLDFDGQQAPRRQQQSARSQGHDHKS